MTHNITEDQFTKVAAVVDSHRVPALHPKGHLSNILTDYAFQATQGELDLRDKEEDFAPRRASFSAEAKQYCMNVYVAYARYAYEGKDDMSRQALAEIDSICA
ncbi:hypothetical protein CspHIS471_0505320 [Cutaneotrichosporon sp. HIS471]|nr:hypothetical protein CspHIS471_0505320 [Cutaneotrichosporon sp. HIS471]